VGKLGVEDDEQELMLMLMLLAVLFVSEGLPNC
jgi:hypothetical protein